jgi:hypothetical protein
MLDVRLLTALLAHLGRIDDWVEGVEEEGAGWGEEEASGRHRHHHHHHHHAHSSRHSHHGHGLASSRPDASSALAHAQEAAAALSVVAQLRWRLRCELAAADRSRSTGAFQQPYPSYPAYPRMAAAAAPVPEGSAADVPADEVYEAVMGAVRRVTGGGAGAGGADFYGGALTPLPLGDVSLVQLAGGHTVRVRTQQQPPPA